MFPKVAYLPFGVFRGMGVVDDRIGTPPFLGHWQLGSFAGLELFDRPASLQSPLLS